MRFVCVEFSLHEVFFFFLFLLFHLTALLLFLLFLVANLSILNPRLIHNGHLCESQAPSSGQSQLKRRSQLIKSKIQNSKHFQTERQSNYDDNMVTLVKVPVGCEVVGHVGEHHRVLEQGEYRVHAWRIILNVLPRNNFITWLTVGVMPPIAVHCSQYTAKRA